MTKIKNLRDAAIQLKIDPDATVGELVDELTRLGYTDKVNAYHDDVLGLDNSISDELKKMSINDITDTEELQEQFESEIEDITSNTEYICDILNREENEEMLEDIAENIYSQTGKFSWDD